MGCLTTEYSRGRQRLYSHVPARQKVNDVVDYSVDLDSTSSVPRVTRKWLSAFSILFRGPQNSLLRHRAIHGSEKRKWFPSTKVPEAPSSSPTLTWRKSLSWTKFGASNGLNEPTLSHFGIVISSFDAICWFILTLCLPGIEVSTRLWSKWARLILRKGTNNRQVGQTDVNEHSSRSHLISTNKWLLWLLHSLCLFQARRG